MALGWFVVSLVVSLIGGTRLRAGARWVSIAWLLAVLFLGVNWALLTFGIPSEIVILTLIALVHGLFWIYKLPNWNAIGQVAWSMMLLVTIIFIIYSFTVTVFTPLNPLSFLLAIIFFFLETVALLLGLTHAFESFDVTCRLRWRRLAQLQQIPGYAPKVSLHVPTYNEPPKVVEHTLRSLAALNYQNYEVLVVDNNTPEEENWRALEVICNKLGPRFRCLHLDHWPGFKSGALNFALTQTAPDAELIGVVDADYQLEPNFLQEMTQFFRDPTIGFVQAPQDYRDAHSSAFAEAIYYGYRYFFEVSMPSRNERNAIIFCGTMGLLRKSVLQEIGGWDEWCITEDAEASLRVLKQGYQSLYVHKTYGRGLMPFTFEGLKKQRFRWCFGGIQILRKHWEALMPWAHAIDPNNRLTAAQRYHYLLGGLQWYTDLLNLLFAFFLVLGGLFSLFTRTLTIRPLVGPLLIVPGVFLLLNTWRFVWVKRYTFKLSLGRALRAMYGFFSLGWVVTLASLQGLIQAKGIFLRTPKSEGQSRLRKAVQVTQWETGIGLLCLTIGLVSFLVHPTVNTAVLGAMLLWESSLYLAAPAYSLMSAYAPRAQAGRVTEQGLPVREQWAARWALGLITLILIGALVAQLIPQPQQPPSYARLQPPDVPVSRLLGVDHTPPEERATPLPTPSDTPTPLPTLTPTVASSPTASLTPNVTATPIVTATVAATPTPTLPAATQTPTIAPSTTAVPTITPPAATPTPVIAPSSTAIPTVPPPAATSTPTITPIITATPNPGLGPTSTSAAPPTQLSLPTPTP